jgi:S-adenosylmethionine synthetase
MDFFNGLLGRERESAAMARKIIITPLSRQPIEQCPVEMCEHKGIGHPDTLADGVCEAASRELSLAYLKDYGKILHHNLDKGLVVAGRSSPRFGGGTVIDPIQIIICGRATHVNADVDVPAIAVEAARRYLQTHIRCDLKQFQITTQVKEGSDDLKEVFTIGDSVAMANDTSFGCGYAPYSRLEQAVLDLSRLLTSSTFRATFPAAGDDFKVMGHRVNGAIHFTIALAFIDRHIEGVEHYFKTKTAIRNQLADHLEAGAVIRINTLDNPDARNECGLYLTVSGLSAEMGDDGQVGRGNRVNGLITPGRAMSLEAAAGKNPASHVGKLYNVLAMLIARDLHTRIEGLDEVGVTLLSAIGERTDQPQVAAVEIGAQGRLTKLLREHVTGIVNEWFDDIGRVTHLILEEKVTLY